MRAQREEDEEKRKPREGEKVLRQIEEQLKYIVDVEVPVVDYEDLTTKYLRIFDIEVVDEVFPGSSQPQPKQVSPPSKQPAKQKAKVKPTTPKAPKAKTTTPKAPKSPTAKPTKKLTPRRKPIKHRPIQPNPPPT